MPVPETTLAAVQPEEALELDELWTFVRHRRRGVVWRWLARCRRTRPIVAYALGPRDDATARLLWTRIPVAYRKAFSILTIWRATTTSCPPPSTAPPTPNAVPPPASSASMTPCVNAWGDSCARPFRFPNAPRCTNSSPASFSTATTWNAITF
ncbi:MAG TPA: hypothetical protein GX399_16095 [Xanthomonadaceae bacterium]|nr:hypothetical protein [Xanthomonadaceae bacterium]